VEKLSDFDLREIVEHNISIRKYGYDFFHKLATELLAAREELARIADISKSVKGGRYSKVDELIDTIIAVDVDGDLSERIDGNLYIEALHEHREIIAELSALREATRQRKVEEKPDTKQPVLAIVKDNVIHIEKACYIPPKTVLADDFLSDEWDCESAAEYDEEKDCYWVTEGWWEASWDAETNWKIAGEVIGWLPLPPVEEKRNEL
jgi:hypothetical protein